MTGGKRVTKQEIIDEICGLLGIGPFTVGIGSTEPAQFFLDLGECLAVDLEGVSSKPEIGRRIVESFGLTWDETCDSTSSTSGGGSTVTTLGIQRLKQAVVAYLSKFGNDPQLEINIRPRTGSLRIFRNLTFKAWYALGEFVDNSVTSAIQNLDQLKTAFRKIHYKKVSLAGGLLIYLNLLFFLYSF